MFRFLSQPIPRVLASLGQLCPALWVRSHLPPTPSTKERDLARHRSLSLPVVLSVHLCGSAPLSVIFSDCSSARIEILPHTRPVTTELVDFLHHRSHLLSPLARLNILANTLALGRPQACSAQVQVSVLIILRCLRTQACPFL